MHQPNNFTLVHFSFSSFSLSLGSLYYVFVLVNFETNLHLIPYIFEMFSVKLIEIAMLFY